MFAASESAEKGTILHFVQMLILSKVLQVAGYNILEQEIWSFLGEGWGFGNDLKSIWMSESFTLGVCLEVATLLPSMGPTI
jgi:hypothetical protein